MNIKGLGLKNINNYIIDKNQENWLINSIIYGSYNCILLIPILISMKDYIKDKRDIKNISIISTIIFMILLTIVYMFLINIDVDIKQLEMPVIYVIQKISPKLKIIYGIIILISILTTAISLGMSFLKNTSKSKSQFNKINIIICISAILFSQIGFSKLVTLLYPILGRNWADSNFTNITKKMLQKRLKTGIT